MTVLIVAVGAALGAPARYLADVLLTGRHDSRFPWATFAVNVAGSGLLGFLAALPAGHGLMAFAGTGFCGALTTYSTFGLETVRLAQSGARTLAVLNVAASVTAGLGAAYCGMAVAQAI
ncbi:MAG TPA: CrcB family protein [Streptosporangiaceae bacterium]|nr:CrcB family protein [Streptosporangiaceae bacterium]